MITLQSLLFIAFHYDFPTKSLTMRNNWNKVRALYT